MEEVIKTILGMKQNQWMMIAGFAFVAFGGGAKVSGLAATEGFELHIIGSGVLFALIGAMMAMVRSAAEGRERSERLAAEARMEAERSHNDTKIRIAKLHAGLNPADDQTVIGRVPPAEEE